MTDIDKMTTRPRMVGRETPLTPGIPSRDLSYADLYGALLEVVTPHGIQASSDRLYRAVFGRDSLRVGLDLLPWHPKIAETVLYSLARLQGRVIDGQREEEPGRIHHEFRSLYLDGRRVDDEQARLMEHLGSQWGWLVPGEELAYYGSVDATPLFVRLVALYCMQYGTSILGQTVRHHDGTEVTIGMAVLSAMDWIEARLDTSPLGFVEFCRVNPQGIRFQVMRDGSVSYLHEDGTIANFRAPIASLEVQGYAYDALIFAADLFSEALPERAACWRERAALLQQAVFSHFWMPERGFFAMAIDRDLLGMPRHIATATSVPAELLETAIFDTLPPHERERYLASIVCAMYSPDFLTSVGIRSRSLQYGNLLSYWDYQGSFTSWIVTTNVFATGLRRQGLLAHASDMEARLINSANIAGTLPEFFYVDAMGRVHYDLRPRTENQSTVETIRATNHPELNQAWSISAILRARLMRKDARHMRARREGSITRKSGLKKVRARLLRGAHIQHSYPSYSAAFDRQGGIDAEHDYLESMLPRNE
jgi:glycogen debranching enzyme